MMAFNLADFKVKWRALAAERGIDVAEGATSYQVAAAKAEARKRTHVERQRAAVWQNAQTHTPDHVYQTHDHVPLVGRSGRWSAIPLLRTCRYTHWDNGAGLVDFEKIERAEGRDWWIDPDLWVIGKSRFTVKVRVEAGVIEMNGVIAATEVQAVRNIRAEARRRHGQGVEPTPYEQVDGALREAWIEDGKLRAELRLMRDRYLASLPKQAAFEFAY